MPVRIKETQRQIDDAVAEARVEFWHVAPMHRRDVLDLPALAAEQCARLVNRLHVDSEAESRSVPDNYVQAIRGLAGRFALAAPDGREQVPNCDRVDFRDRHSAHRWQDIALEERHPLPGGAVVAQFMPAGFEGVAHHFFQKVAVAPASRRSRSRWVIGSIPRRTRWRASSAAARAC
jgi:hypothetical protein